MFDKELSAQIVAYFLWREGGVSPYLKITKLLYLAERTYLLEHGGRLTGDSMFSLKHGPILSQSLDMMKYGDEDPDSPWQEWIEGESDYRLKLRKPVQGVDDFDLFSRATHECLDKVYEQFGHYTQWELRNKTHTKEVCPEWQNPGDSCIPIQLKDLLRCHGKSEEESQQIEDFIREQDAYQQLVRELR